MKTDRERLIGWIEESRNYALDDGRIAYSGEIADYLISNGVTIPVRCSDCQYRDSWYLNEKFKFWICGTSGLYIVEDSDFCSHGERKEP